MNPSNTTNHNCPNRYASKHRTSKRPVWRRRMSRITTAMFFFLAVTGSGSPAWAVDAGTEKLHKIIGNITVWVTGLLIGVATLFLTIGGLRYLAAGGDPTEVEKAKSAFKSALIGYALAVLAPVLLTVVQGWIGG